MSTIAPSPAPVQGSPQTSDDGSRPRHWAALFVSRIHKPTEYAAIFLLTAWLLVRSLLTSRMTADEQSRSLLDFFGVAVNFILVAYGSLVLSKLAVGLRDLKRHRALTSLWFVFLLMMGISLVNVGGFRSSTAALSAIASGNTQAAATSAREVAESYWMLPPAPVVYVAAQLHLPPGTLPKGTQVNMGVVLAAMMALTVAGFYCLFLRLLPRVVAIGASLLGAAATGILIVSMATGSIPWVREGALGVRIGAASLVTLFVLATYARLWRAARAKAFGGRAPEAREPSDGNVETPSGARRRRRTPEVAVEETEVDAAERLLAESVLPPNWGALAFWIFAGLMIVTDFATFTLPAAGS